LAVGQDRKNGINNLIKSIRKDLELNNFFNLYEPNSGLKDIRQSLIHRTALTKDLFEDLTITFNSDLFDTFQAEKNYTIQSLFDCLSLNSERKEYPIATPVSPFFLIGSTPRLMSVLSLTI
jgi:hypothetical protein